MSAVWQSRCKGLKYFSLCFFFILLACFACTKRTPNHYTHNTSLTLCTYRPYILDRAVLLYYYITYSPLFIFSSGTHTPSVPLYLLVKNCVHNDEEPVSPHVRYTPPPSLPFSLLTPLHTLQTTTTRQEADARRGTREPLPTAQLEPFGVCPWRGCRLPFVLAFFLLFQTVVDHLLAGNFPCCLPTIRHLRSSLRRGYPYRIPLLLPSRML